VTDPRVEERVRGLLAQVLDVAPETIGPGFTAASVPSWTSLNHLMLVSQVETEFGVFFSNQEIRDIDSFDRLVEVVSGHLRAAG
jgi:acyl carrier protein